MKLQDVILKAMAKKIAPEMLERQAQRMSDTDAAQRMQKVKIVLLVKSRGTR